MDRIRSEQLRTIDATVVAHGAVRRPGVELPADGADEVSADEVIRLSLGGDLTHARFQSFSGGVRVTGAFDTPDLVRSPGDGQNRLRAWLDDQNLDPGRTVHLDVIEPGFKYGLRAPGESIVYDAPEPPDDSLASIAADLEDGE